jgi:hypothetical protein
MQSDKQRMRREIEQEHTKSSSSFIPIDLYTMARSCAPKYPLLSLQKRKHEHAIEERRTMEARDKKPKDLSNCLKMYLISSSRRNLPDFFSNIRFSRSVIAPMSSATLKPSTEAEPREEPFLFIFGGISPLGSYGKI